jgi:hypothetical protein
MVDFGDKVLWITLAEVKGKLYEGKKFKIIDDVTEEDDMFNKGSKKYVIHMIEPESGNRYNGNLNNTSIYGLMKAWGKETVNWSGNFVTIEMQIVKGKEAIIYKAVA